MVAATPTPVHPGRVLRGSRGSTHTRSGWRADVVALIASDAELLEYVRSSSYGVATSYPKGDDDLDGDVDAADTTALSNFIAGSGGWNLDFNRDGNTDGDDTTEHATYRTGYTGGTGGRGTLSRSALKNRMGYAGYHFDDTLNGYHVRHRVYMPEIGRWSRRDPAGYPEVHDLYSYCQHAPLNRGDPSGRRSVACNRASRPHGMSFQEMPPVHEVDVYRPIAPSDELPRAAAIAADYGGCREDTPSWVRGAIDSLLSRLAKCGGAPALINEPGAYDAGYDCCTHEIVFSAGVAPLSPLDVGRVAALDRAHESP